MCRYPYVKINKDPLLLWMETASSGCRRFRITLGRDVHLGQEGLFLKVHLR